MCSSAHVAVLIKRHVCRGCGGDVALDKRCYNWVGDALFCHPERSEGSVRNVCRIHHDKLRIVRMFALRNVCWNRCVQIPHCVRDDSDSPPCHPERSEGSVRFDCRMHPNQLGLRECGITVSRVYIEVSYTASIPANAPDLLNEKPQYRFPAFCNSTLHTRSRYCASVRQIRERRADTQIGPRNEPTGTALLKTTAPFLYNKVDENERDEWRRDARSTNTRLRPPNRRARRNPRCAHG